VTKIDPTFEYDFERFIIKPWRNDLLDRSLARVQWWFEANVKRTRTLPRWITDYRNATGNQLLAMLWQVGWDDTLRGIINSLSEADRRKLVGLAAELWQQKGTELGLGNFIRAVTGHEAEIENWFFYRWILGETGLWYGYSPTMPWMWGSTLTPMDEFLSGIFIMDEGGIDYDLVSQVVDLARPLGEHYQIIYMEFVDNFRLGREKWTTFAGTAAVWNSTTKSLELPVGTVEFTDTLLAPGWPYEQNVLCTFQITNPAQIPTFGWTATAGPGAAPDGVFCEVDPLAGTVDLSIMWGGAPVLLQSVPLTVPVVPGLKHWFRVSTSDLGAGNIRIRTYVDNVLHNDWNGALAFASGYLYAWNQGPAGVMTLDNVRLFVPPLRIDEVGP